MRKLPCSLAIVSLLGCGAAEPPGRAATGALMNGVPDPGDYPNVGTLVVPSAASGPGAPPPFVSQCTGTLVAPDVFLTAGHCARRVLTLPHGTFGVTFEAAYVPGVTPFRPGTAFVHPGFDFATGVLDVGVVVLDAPVEGIDPAPVAAHDTLAKMDPLALADARVVAVGYGSTDATRFGPENGRGTRRVAIEQVLGVCGADCGAPVDNWLALGGAFSEGFGASSFGDSGGPRFLDGELISLSSKGPAPDPAFGLEYTQRIDVKEAHRFVKAFIDGESAPYRQDL